ncbi:MAG: hypothetical protein C0490_22290 [Marivirga sp.]|nr:hypothetical protein [Marivirga sp.]
MYSSTFIVYLFKAFRVSDTVAANDQVLLQVGNSLFRPARNHCAIENIKLKLTTKSQFETRLPEQTYSNASSRSFNVQRSNTNVVHSYLSSHVIFFK